MQDPGNGSVPCPCGCGGWVQPETAATLTELLAERPGARHTPEQVAALTGRDSQSEALPAQQMGAAVAPEAAPAARVKDSGGDEDQAHTQVTPEAPSSSEPDDKPAMTVDKFDLGTTEGVRRYYQFVHGQPKAPSYP